LLFWPRQRDRRRQLLSCDIDQIMRAKLLCSSAVPTSMITGRTSLNTFDMGNEDNLENGV
jgi:hypothetical protein